MKPVVKNFHKQENKTEPERQTNRFHSEDSATHLTDGRKTTASGSFENSSAPTIGNVVTSTKNEKARDSTANSGTASTKKVESVYEGDQQRQNIYCYLKQKFYASSKINALSSRLGNRTCALVSTSGALLARESGKEIDAHDVVFRFHNSPTGYWSKNVGSRTDYNLVGTHTGMDVEQGSSHMGQIYVQDKVKEVFAELYPNRMGMHKVPIWGVHDPTTGSKGVLIALANCKSIDAYQMSPSKDAHQYPYHYYDVPDGKSNIKADDNDFHGMSKAEHDLWRRISTSAKSDHEYSGKTTYPGFSTVACPENAGSLGVLGFAYKEYEDEDDADEVDI